MKLYILAFCLAVSLSESRWVERRGRSGQPKQTSFVGEATNQLSTAILQGYLDDNNNIAFSPLGYASILAIIAEGARGETKEQLVSALHLPADDAVTRKTFKFIMERLKNTHEYKYNQPELKNYFYIYKNYTINDDYKKILEDYYMTEVRSVEKVTHEHIKEDTDEKDDKKIESKIEVELEEKPEMEETTKTAPKESQEKLISFAMEDKPEKVEQIPYEYKPAKNIKEKIKLVKTYPNTQDEGEEEETMVAVEARNHARSLRILMNKSDVSSSLSVNSVGRKQNPKSTNSLMIIFNGMYFRGSWKVPFKSIENGVFYKSTTEKKQTPMMKRTGTFRTGSLPGLDSEAIEFPYEGDRYVLLAVVPKARDGLSRLIADLPGASLADIQESLQEKELDVSIPSFYVETTTKPVAALAKFGVSSIFTPEADLSGVSPSEGLFVQELVQHVAVRVDNADSSASQLTAVDAAQPAPEENIESLKNLPLTDVKIVSKFSVEHPFLFFIVDRLDNLVVVAGKVTDPEQPTSFEI